MMFTASPPFITPMETMAVLSGVHAAGDDLLRVHDELRQRKDGVVPLWGWEPWAFWPVTATL